MRKLYTTLFVSAIISASYASLPVLSGSENGFEDKECVVSNDLFGFADTNAQVSNNGESTVTIYPNPVKSYATISFTYQNIDRISIMNIVGREIKSIIPENGKQEIKVSLVDLQPGVYFLAAYYQGNTLITKKFLKEE